MGDKPLGVGVIGAGTVGGATIKLLKERKDLLSERAGREIKLVAASDLSVERLRSLGVTEAETATSATDLIENKDVDVVVELVGGTTFAYDFVNAALENGKCVVTANKALLAERGVPLFSLAAQKKVSLGFEAAVAGAIPIIRSVRDGLVADRIEQLLGIVNGTCNYILSQMRNCGQDYETALQDAQKLGYAEADPTFDVEGFDSAHKLALLSTLGFDTNPEFKNLHVEGISKLKLSDVKKASELGYVVKLLAVARPKDGELFLSVHPALLSKDHPLASVNGSMNAVSIFSDAALEGMYYGRGAGDTPTASAVISDIVEIARIGTEPKTPPVWSPEKKNLYKVGDMNDYECRFFVRFTVQEHIGVLGKIATILGEQNVSIASVVQEEEKDTKVPITLLTHRAREGSLRTALDEINKLDFIAEPTGVLRVEE